MNQPIVFGKYLLLDRINVGGMAEVFKAKTFGVEGFQRLIAIKRILPNMAEDDEFINMFVDEARIAVQLSHPNIVQIYELGKFENQYYIAMEYVPGKDLRQFLDLYRKREKLLPLPAAAYVVTRVCEGLDYAHHQTDPSGRPLNVIHRDVSPQNILLGYEGAVKVTDFGIAKAEDRASKTQAGVLKGKFGYMSPEQVRGLEIDRRSDIFAVGILMYEMLTGQRLFVGESDFSTLEKVRAAEIPPPREHNPSIPEELEAILLKTLAKDRDERYQTGSDLVDDLQQYLIDDNRIFGAKQMAALLREDYQEEIESERRRLDEYMRIQAPKRQDVDEAAQHHRDAAPSSGDWRSDMHSEKTMIFDSSFGDLADAPTRIDEELDQAAVTGEMGDASGPGASRVSVVRTRSRRSGKAPKARGANDNRLVLFAGAAVVLLLAAALVFALLPRGRTGTIIVTSTPTDTVDIYLDDKLIGDKTPITDSTVPEGEHTLLARAPGYADKAYRFQLAPNAPAIINVELEPLAASSAATVNVKVVTEPPGASIRVDGLPQGTTPLTLQDRDPARPLVVEVSKPGYRTESVPYAFTDTGVEQVFRHTLQPLSTGAADGGAASLGAGSIEVRSTPSKATVYLGKTRKGFTPLVLRGLDTSARYSIEVTKSGFRAYRKEVRFNGDPSVTVEATLEELPRPVKKPVSASRAGCGGSGSRLSVMAVGASDCEITVGRARLGVAPVFKKEAPTGRCEIKVTCADGKSYRTVRTLKNGDAEKVIIRPDDWK